MLRFTEDYQPPVGMDIDEAGANNMASNINNAVCFNMTNIAPVDTYSVAVNTDGSKESWIPCTIND